MGHNDEEEHKVYISIDMDYDFISTKDLEQILDGFRKTLNRIVSYRSDPLSITRADFEFGSGILKISSSIYCSKNIDVIEFVRDKFTRPTRKNVKENINRRDNLKNVHADFEIEGEHGEELSWSIKR